MEKIIGTTSPSSGQKDRVTVHKTQQEADYWASFYERTGFDRGSSFFEFVSEQADLPSTLVDIGCGDGRDSFAFARTGKTVVGLDRSEVGVEHADKKAVDEALGDTLAFLMCDVSNESELQGILEQIREKAGDKPLAFYLRFFLHSIPEDVQERLLAVLSSSAQPGDVFAAEFRTDKDEYQNKVFGNSHYRRYQNAKQFSSTLQDHYGWEIAFEAEDTGLSPYKDEDPTLYRVVARRP